MKGGRTEVVVGMGVITYHFPFRLEDVRPNILDKARKSFIQPEVVPPLHGYQVTKPLENKGQGQIDVQGQGQIF
jgi:hypothetical protein